MMHLFKKAMDAHTTEPCGSMWLTILPGFCPLRKAYITKQTIPRLMIETIYYWWNDKKTFMNAQSTASSMKDFLNLIVNIWQSRVITHSCCEIKVYWYGTPMCNNIYSKETRTSYRDIMITWLAGQLLVTHSSYTTQHWPTILHW